MYWCSHFNPLPPHGGRPTQIISGWKKNYFNPLPPHGGRPPAPIIRQFVKTFQSTPSAWRETGFWTEVFLNEEISIHSLRMEGDEYTRVVIPRSRHFHPPPPPGGRRVFPVLSYAHGRISIHSLRMEGDITPDYFFRRFYISIHSLRMEGDFAGWLRPVDPEIFQSTPSAWRETEKGVVSLLIGEYFNPLPPHGGRPQY